MTIAEAKEQNSRELQKFIGDVNQTGDFDLKKQKILHRIHLERFQQCSDKIMPTLNFVHDWIESLSPVPIWAHAAPGTWTLLAQDAVPPIVSEWNEATALWIGACHIICDPYMPEGIIRFYPSGGELANLDYISL